MDFANLNDQPMTALLARSAALVLAAFITTRLMRRAAASSRHLVWTSTLLMLLVLPAATLLLPAIPLRILPPSDAARVAVAPAGAEPVVGTPGVIRNTPVAATVDEVAVSSASAAEAPLPPVPAPATSTTPAAAREAGSVVGWLAAMSTELLVLVIWLAVGAGLLLHLIISHVRLRAIARTSWLVRDADWERALTAATRALNITRPVRLLATGETSVPMTWGTRAPVVLLPAEALEWSGERRIAVLVHELAHVARRDALTHDVARVAASLYWPNPLVWLALKAMRAERERACDDLVLTSGLKASAYAADLLDIARNVSYRPVGVAALAMARRTELEGRLLAILDPRAPRGRPGRLVRAAVVAVALLLTVPLAALRPAPAIAEQPPTLSGAPAGVEPVFVAGSASVSEAALATRAAKASDSAAAAAATTASRRADGSAESTTASTREPQFATATMAPDATPAVDAEQPAQLKMPGEWSPAALLARIRAPQSLDERQTLIAVAVAARRMTSDYEKAELLLEVADHYVNDDSLRAAYLATAATISGNYERHRVLMGLLKKDSLQGGGSTQFLKMVGDMSGNYERSLLLNAFIKVHPLTNARVRQEFFAAMGKNLNHEMQVLLGRIIVMPWFDAAIAIDLLEAAKGVSSSYSKGEILVAVARTGLVTDEAVRKAFMSTAETLTTDSDYGRAMAAAAGRGRKP